MIVALQNKLIKIVSDLAGDVELSNLSKINLELPKDKSHGCLATNAAMLTAKDLKDNPRNIAEKYKQAFLDNIAEIKSIDIAGPGFINLTMHKEFWQNSLKDIFVAEGNFGKSKIGNKEKVNVEFGSPNPTGPLHVGHTRGAIFGDILANILEFADYDVTRENYVNDAGGQITILAKSLFMRYIEIAKKEKVEIPEGYYPGDYLIPIAEKIYAEDGDKFINSSEEEYLPQFKKIAVAGMLEIIKDGFANLNIKHDVHFSEKSLHDDKVIDQVIEKLGKDGKTYIGTLPKPKGQEVENWEAKEQLLFKASEFGDDIDRALQKNDGSWTYFAADAAYHFNKLSRGFNKMILILGADHGGYIKRMKALISALSDGKAEIDIKLCQLVKFAQDGVVMKMSKRDGTFITAEEVVEKVGIDPLRFIMLTRKNDAILEFDFAKAIDESKDNPIFYVQYAHARICSVLRQNQIETNLDSLHKLTHEAELDLIRYLNIFPQTIEIIANNYEAHRLTFYLLELATKFHSYWNLGKVDSSLKFVTEDEEVTKARIILLQTVKNVLSIGLNLFNIKPVDSM